MSCQIIWRAALHSEKNGDLDLDIDIDLDLYLDLYLVVPCGGILFPECDRETSRIITDQSEQAMLPLPLQFCQSTFRNSDFRDPQLAET